MGGSIWTYVHLETASIGVVQPLTSHWQEGLGKEEKVVWISGRVWTETAKDEKRICKEKSVIELRLIFLTLSLILILLYLCVVNLFVYLFFIKARQP
jgi:hypothetical protein